MRERHVKLFRSAGAQALAIPRELELPGDEVILRRDGARLIVEPKPAPAESHGNTAESGTGGENRG